MVGFAPSLACRMNVPVTHHEPLNADALRSRFKARHDAYGEDNRVRIHRALSWLRRAEQELEDPDARFIFLWIAFNASYAHEFGHEEAEREQLSRFFARLLTVDGDGRLHALLFQRFSGPIRTLIDNRYVFAPFWRALRERQFRPLGKLHGQQAGSLWPGCWVATPLRCYRSCLSACTS